MGNVDSALPASERVATGQARQDAKAFLEEHLSERGFSSAALSAWSSSLQGGREGYLEELAAAVRAGSCQLESDEADTLIRRVSVVEIDIIAALERGNAILMEEERVFSDGYRQPWPCKPHAVFKADETPTAAAARALQAMLGLSNEVVARFISVATCEEEAFDGEGESDVEQAVALAFPGLPCCCSLRRLKLHLQNADASENAVLLKRIGLPQGVSFATSEQAASSASETSASSGTLGRGSCMHLWRWKPVGTDVSGIDEKKHSFDLDLDIDQDEGTSGTALEETHSDLKMVIKQLSHHKVAFCQVGCLTEAAIEEMQERLRRVIQRISNIDDLVHHVNVENVLAQITHAQTDPGETMARNCEFRDFISSNFMESSHFDTDLEFKRRTVRSKTLSETRRKTWAVAGQTGPVQRRYTIATTDARSCRGVEMEQRNRASSSSFDDCPKENEGKEARSTTVKFEHGKEVDAERPDSAKPSSLENERKTASSRVTFGRRQSFEPEIQSPKTPSTPARSTKDFSTEKKDEPPEPLLEDSVRDAAEAIKASGGQGQWVCDTQSISDNTRGAALQVVAEVYILPQVAEFGTSAAVMRRFISALHGSYLKNLNPFHNETHVALVTHATRWLCNGGKGWTNASVVERVATDIAVLSHDAGHFGRNNSFCINTRHWLALTYNDRSVLENMHAATCFQLMQGDDRNILANLTKENAKFFREHAIDLILATDMASHFEFLGQFRIALVKEDFDPENERRDRELVTRCCVKAADLGHTALPWDLHEPWVLRLLTEFYEQGDQEKQLGFPVSPMCSRSSDIAEFQKSQKGFLQFLVTPLYVELKRVQLEVDIHDVCISRIEQNATKWVEDQPSKELVAIVTGKPQEGKDGIISPEFAVQKRPAMKYLPVCASQERHQVFKIDDEVWIIKESRFKGKLAKVVDPSWRGGLVKVTMIDDDNKESIKSYHPFELQLAVTVPVASNEE